MKNAITTAAKSSRVLNMETNLSEILDIITEINDETISDQILRISKTTELLDTIEISEHIENIDTTMYCFKTGKPLSSWSNNDLRQLYIIVGEKRMKYLIYKKQFNNCQPAWIFTDPKSLENLFNHDPVGYFVYAVNYIMPHDLEILRRDDEIKETYIYQRNIEKTVVWLQLQNITIEEIIQTNEIMRRYLTFIKTNRAVRVIMKAKKSGLPSFFEFTLTNVALDNAVVETFRQCLKNIIREIIKEEYRRNRIKTNITYADVVGLKLRYEGYSNFRSQRRLTSMTEIEHVMLELQEFIPPTFIENTKMDEFVKSNRQTGVEAIKVKKSSKIKIAAPTKKPVKISFATALRKS